MKKENDRQFPEKPIVIYSTPDGTVKVDVLYENENLWLTQAAIAKLFGVGVPAVNKHLKNIYAEGELTETATVSKMEIVKKSVELSQETTCAKKAQVQNEGGLPDLFLMKRRLQRRMKNMINFAFVRIGNISPSLTKPLKNI